MKKRYVMLAAMLILSLSAIGCGKKEEKKVTPPAVTATPAPTAAPTEAPAKGELVQMQKSENSDIKNVIGEKTAAASKLVLINQTGADIASVYVRPTIDDDEEWGSELVQGKFVLKNGEKALYYFDPNKKDENGNVVSTYDIRIVYTDEDRYDCYFRKLPLKNIGQVTLCMDESGDSSIPYAKYLSGTSKKEFSTLNEVKHRLGLLDYDDTEENDQTEETGLTPTPEITSAPEVTQAPDDTEDSDELPKSDEIKAAEGCIGQSLDTLFGVCGEPIGSDYQEEPETGETGYHYYDTFTVSTTVDEDGNEIVSGVW